MKLLYNYRVGNSKLYLYGCWSIDGSPSVYSLFYEQY